MTRHVQRNAPDRVKPMASISDTTSRNDEEFRAERTTFFGCRDSVRNAPLAMRISTDARRVDARGGGGRRQVSLAIDGARKSRKMGDHLACSGPLAEWPRALSSSK